MRLRLPKCRRRPCKPHYPDPPPHKPPALPRGRRALYGSEDFWEGGGFGNYGDRASLFFSASFAAL